MLVPNTARCRTRRGTALLAAACAAGLMLAAIDVAQAHKRGGGGDSKKPPYHGPVAQPPVAQPPVAKPPVMRPQGGVVRDHRTRPTPVVRDHRAGAPVVKDHRARPAMPVYRVGKVTRAVTGRSGIPRAVTRVGERPRVATSAGGVGVGVSEIQRRKKADCGTGCKTKRNVAGVGQTFKNGGRAIGKKVRDIF